ncbi:MAG: hypothetical protein Q7S19_02635 [bacterium]|nr:hypothetical protein [bacterium]
MMGGDRQMGKKVGSYDLPGEINMLTSMLRRELWHGRGGEVRMIKKLLAHAKQLATEREEATVKAKRDHVDRGPLRGKCSSCKKDSDIREILCGTKYKKLCRPCDDSVRLF